MKRFDNLSLLIIAKNEYVTRSREKVFIVMSLLLPLGFLLIYFFHLYPSDAPKKQHLIFLDYTQSHYTHFVVDLFNETPFTVEIHSTYLNNLDLRILQSKMINRIFDKEAIVMVEVFLKEGQFYLDISTLRELPEGLLLVLEKAAWLTALEQSHLNPIPPMLISKDILPKTHIKTNYIAPNPKPRDIIITFFLYVLFSQIAIYGTILTTTILENKNSHELEYLVSMVTPHHVTLGKILGIGLVGLSQFAFWILLFLGNMLIQDVYSVLDTIQYFFLALVLFSLSYAIYAPYYFTIGVKSQTAQEAHFWSLLIIVVSSIPIMSLSYINQFPDPVLTIISFIPAFFPIVLMSKVNMSAESIFSTAIQIFIIIGFILYSIKRATFSLKWHIQNRI